MIEISLNDLRKDNFYEKTLQSLETICDDYKITNHFGAISMFNQIVCDYLLDSDDSFHADVVFHILEDELSITYDVYNKNFSFLSTEDESNTALFVMKRLADEVAFSSDNMQLTSTFHVKTKSSSNIGKRDFVSNQKRVRADV